MFKLCIELEKLVPFPFYEVLAQYYDYEHIEHVHPKSLGRYEMHEQKDTYVAYRQIWPKSILGQAESIVRHYHDPPNRMRFEFIVGRHKGTVVHTTLHEAEGGTLVHEAYEMNLPNWSWLKPLVFPFVKRQVDHVWYEDLAVEVCHDGWPGIPEAMLPEGASPTTPGTHDTEITVPLADIPEGAAAVVTSGNLEIALFRRNDAIHAIENRCPHTGGPLSLGEIHGDCVTCPWHGRRFNLHTGAPEQPYDTGIHVYPVTREADTIRVTLSGG